MTLQTESCFLFSNIVQAIIENRAYEALGFPKLGRIHHLKDISTGANPTTQAHESFTSTNMSTSFIPKHHIPKQPQILTDLGLNDHGSSRVHSG